MGSENSFDVISLSQDSIFSQETGNKTKHQAKQVQCHEVVVVVRLHDRGASLHDFRGALLYDLMRGLHRLMCGLHDLMCGLHRLIRRFSINNRPPTRLNGCRRLPSSLHRMDLIRQPIADHIGNWSITSSMSRSSLMR